MLGTPSNWTPERPHDVVRAQLRPGVDRIISPDCTDALGPPRKYVGFRQTGVNSYPMSPRVYSNRSVTGPYQR